MGKGLFQELQQKVMRRLSDASLFFPLMLAGAVAWVIKDPLTNFLFTSHSAVKTLLSFLLAFLLCFLVFYISSRFAKWFSDRMPHGKPVRTTLNVSEGARLSAIMVILGAGLTLTLFINQVLPRIDLDRLTFLSPKIVPTMDPVGNDFRTGLYRTPGLLLEGEQIYYLKEDGSNLTQYPPLLNLLFLPYQMFEEDTAYIIHVVLLFLANLACLGLAARWTRDFILPRTGFEPPTQNLLAWLLFFVMAAFTFTGYPFLFSIERGNYDILALFYAMLAVHILLYRPKRIWLQVILLSVAVHLKIYPAALFVLLLCKHGKRLVLPTLAVNLAFLLSLGPTNALIFVQIIRHNVAAGFTWVGNHSAFSFATYLSWIYPAVENALPWLRSLTTILPVVIWAASLFWLLTRRQTGSARLLLLFTFTVPLMDVIPPISHDYKSVILGPAVLLAMGFLLLKILNRSDFWDYFKLIALMVLLLLLGRSFALNPPEVVLLNQKFPAIIAIATLFMSLARGQLEIQPEAVNAAGTH